MESKVETTTQTEFSDIKPQYDIYQVYYTNSGFSGSSSVFLGGTYKTLEEAKRRIYKLLGNPIPIINNCVSGKRYIGWVNPRNYGDEEYTSNPCNQPENAINLFS